ncbi:MAG: hypothetical protein ACLFQJ_02790 [Campylobacterales bacterium]
MSHSSFFKRGFFASFVLIFIAQSLYALQFVYSPSGLLLPKTVEKMNEISDEIYAKSNVGLFVTTMGTIGDESIESFEEKIIKDLPPSYVLITLVSDIKKIDIRISDDLAKEIDKNEIFWDYMVPLLPKSDRELTTKTISAVIFNGYMEAAYQIKDAKNIEVLSLPDDDSSRVGTIIQWIFYFFAGSLILILIASYIKGSKSE